MGRMGMVLPPQYACVGNAWSMYFGPMVRVYDPSPYTFEVTVAPALDANTQDAAGYYSTPITADIGAHTVTVVCKLSGVEVDSRETALTVVADTGPTKSVLTVGDSITEHGYYQEDLYTLDGNLTFLGTKTDNGYAHEGVGGWTAWHHGHHASSEMTNGGSIDIPNYLATIGATPDVVTWLFGTNDARAVTTSKAHSSNYVRYLEELLAAWETAAPSTQHVLCGCPPGRPESGSGIEQYLVDAWSMWTERMLRDFADTSTRTLCGAYTGLLRVGTTQYPGSDAYHPTTTGHEFLARAIYPAILAAVA